MSASTSSSRTSRWRALRHLSIDLGVALALGAVALTVAWYAHALVTRSSGS